MCDKKHCATGAIILFYNPCHSTKKHNFSSRHLAHQSPSDHFERVLHCDISGRGSCVTHGRSVWRELGGDVIPILCFFFRSACHFSFDYSRHNGHNVTRGRRLRLALAFSRCENLTRTNFMICRYAKPRPVQDELSAWRVGYVLGGWDVCQKIKNRKYELIGLYAVMTEICH